MAHSTSPPFSSPSSERNCWTSDPAFLAFSPHVQILRQLPAYSSSPAYRLSLAAVGPAHRRSQCTSREAFCLSHHPTDPASCSREARRHRHYLPWTLMRTAHQIHLERYKETLASCPACAPSSTVHTRRMLAQTPASQPCRRHSRQPPHQNRRAKHAAKQRD